MQEPQDFSIRNSIQFRLYILDRPLPPQSLTIKERSWNFLVVKWDEPLDIVDKYFVSYSSSKTTATPITISGELRTYQIENLEEQIIYTIKVESIRKRKDSVAATVVVKTKPRPEFGK